MTISRRSFLATGSSALAVLAGAPAFLLRPRGVPAASFVIRNGTVFDGLGNPGVEADVAITDGQISAIGRALRDRGAQEIDARGLAVAPGFIDIHSHGDGSLWSDPRAESLVRQGVTTIVVGQDGSSRAPRRAATNGSDDDEVNTTFRDMWRSIAELKPAVNILSMVGLGTVRHVVVGDDDRPATAAEMARMLALVEDALRWGACGASSGLEYTPGAFAPREELIALCRPLAARRLPYATHMRNEDDHVLEAIDEAIAVARGAGCPLQISHLKMQGPRNWSKLDTAFARIEAARKDGMDVAFDRYPYVAYQTGLTNLFPVWSRDGGTERFLARLGDPSVAPRIRTEALAKVDLIGGWHNVLVSGVGNDGDRRFEGARIDEIATALGQEPYDAAVGLLQRSRGSVGMVGFAMSEENLDRVLAHPSGMICSDGGAFATEGPARRGHPHPRGLGTFPRVLGRYVRERKALTLEQAIRKMTSFPASRVGVQSRGRLAPRISADIVVFDPATVADRATFAEPFQYPAGIPHVFVNGVPALLHGERTEERRGTGIQVS